MIRSCNKLNPTRHLFIWFTNKILGYEYCGGYDCNFIKEVTKLFLVVEEEMLVWSLWLSHHFAKYCVLITLSSQIPSGVVLFCCSVTMDNEPSSGSLERFKLYDELELLEFQDKFVIKSRLSPNQGFRINRLDGNINLLDDGNLLFWASVSSLSDWLLRKCRKCLWSLLLVDQRK